MLSIGLFVIFALFKVHEKADAYWAVAAIFGIGGVLALGGLSGIKGHWWLLKLLMGFRY